MYKKPLRIIAICGMIAASCCVVIGGLMATETDKNATRRDFIEYWAAAHQLVRHANPYDVNALLQLERAAGLEGNQPRVTWSPPACFAVLLPLGFVSAKAGWILWTLAQLACLSVAIGVLWILNGRPDTRYHLLGYLFAPALGCMMAGQLGIFLLLAVVLFLYFHRSRPFIAGAVLFPCAMKPHLFLPVALVLVLWVLHRKAYSVLTGFFCALLAGAAVVLRFDTQVWSHYFQMMHAAQALRMYAPTLSSVFRYFINRQSTWPQFVPEAVACGWASWYFWNRRRVWDWMDHGLLLLLVSIAAAPYSFFSDESMALPAVFAGVYKALESRRSLVPLGLIAGATLIQILRLELYSLFFLWTTPAWIAWYLYATRSKETEQAQLDCSIP